MQEVVVIAKRWGNSIGVTIPKEIAEEENIIVGKKIRLLIPEQAKRVNIREIFGTLKFKKPTQKIKDEMRKGWLPEH